MFKVCLLLLSFALFPIQAVNADSITKEDMYVTTEDIILDIVMPTIDKKIQKEYHDHMVDWKFIGIMGINYNSNHSYDLEVKIAIDPLNVNKRDIPLENLAKIRISPSCDSNKINQMVCKHGFNIELLDYKHLSK
ncbi:hypothetical protein [Bacillus sp. 1P06AnD]|uniref:hypothetical protein n=1 Tax=Bacillus sp. 1P06AnD TaxID=3132208 RepID=UPI0039A27706